MTTTSCVNVPKPRPKRRKRKSTFLIRKEEKQRLLKELAWLQTLHQEEQLRRSPTASAVARVSPPRHARESASAAQATACKRHLGFLGLRSLLSAYASVPQAVATHEPLHLPMDAFARRAVLLRHSVPHMEDARRQALERCRFLDLSKAHVATEWFEDDDGAMTLVLFDVTPFRGIPCTVRDVYDAIGFYTQNVEIYVSERLGSLTIREDDGIESLGVVAGNVARVSQRRLASMTDYGIMDVNVACFRQHFEEGECAELPQEHALYCNQSVDADELYPYVPGERVRHDTHDIRLIRQVPAANGEVVTTLVRMSWLVRRPSQAEHMVPHEAVAALRTQLQQWDDVMVTAVRDYLKASKSTTVVENVSSESPTSPALSVSSPSTDSVSSGSPMSPSSFLL